MPLPDNFPALLFAVSVIFLAGAVVFYAVVGDPTRFSRLERVAYCYPLGLSALGMPMFLMSWAGFHIRVLPVLILIGLAAVISYAVRRVSPASLWKRNPNAAPAKPFSELEWFLLLIIVGCLMVRTMTSLVIPLNDGDGHAVWCFKAKIFFYDTIRTTDYFSRHELNYSNVRYPLLVPFMYTWVSTVVGHWDDQGIFILNPTNLVVFAILLYCTLRKFAVRPVALAVTAMLSSLPALMHYAECGQADVPLMLINGASLFCLLDWIQSRRTDSIILAAFLMGGALFTKEEARIIFMAHLAVAGLSVLWAVPRARWWEHAKQLGIYIGLAGIMALPWFLFRRTIQDYQRSLSAIGFHTIRWDQIPTLLSTIVQTALHFQNSANLPKWNLLWPLIVITMLVNWRQVCRHPWTCLLAIWFLHACGVGLVFLASPDALTYPAVEVGFERYTLIMLPPLWLLLGLGLNRFWEIWKDNRATSTAARTTA
jgi:hypothetical protein